jgi:hypothetical protein
LIKPLACERNNDEERVRGGGVGETRHTHGRTTHGRTDSRVGLGQKMDTNINTRSDKQDGSRRKDGSGEGGQENVVLAYTLPTGYILETLVTINYEDPTMCLFHPTLAFSALA